MPNLFRPFVAFVKSELRLAVSLGVLLLILVGLSLAVDSSYKFDFGDGSPLGLEAGYLAVDGGDSMYPVSASGIQYGWSDSVLVFSDGAAVASKLDRDGNQGVTPAHFRITGLANGNYRLSLRVGGLSSGFATKVTVGGRSFSTATQPNQWNTLAFDASVSDGSLDLLCERAGGSLWGVGSLVVTPSPTPVVRPTFDVTIQPSSHTVRVGGTAVYRISINPLNGYASQVSLSITGLAGDLSAQFAPVSSLLPMVADLTVRSASTTPPTQYDFVVTAKGADADAYTVNQSIGLVVTNSQTAPTTANPDTTIGGSNGTTSPDGGAANPGGSSLDEISLIPRTPADIAQEQAMVDEYAVVEAKKLANTKEILEVRDITNINSFVPALRAEPKTTLESSLQYLTATGIIGTTVDSAPPAPTTAPRTMGFWERFFSTMVNPTI